MNITRSTALMLSLMLLLSPSLTACQGESDNGDIPVTTAAQTEAPTPSLDLSLFTITRPERASVSMLQQLRNQIKKACGLELKLGDDFVLPGKIDEPEYEILLGKVEREASAAVYEKLDRCGYAVVRSGSKIILAGNGIQPLNAAIDYFLAHYFADGSFILPPENEQEYYAVYPYDYYNDTLYGKTINLLGDSYIAGEGLAAEETWGGMLGDKYGMTVRNYGKSGNGIASPQASGTPMYLRYTKMKNDADIVLVVGGRNDYNQRYPVGVPGDTTADTFCGALSILIDGLREKYPSSLILFSTPWYVNEEMAAYSDAMLAVCEAKNMPCFHAADKNLSGVDMTNPTFRSTFCMQPNDVSHLNADGMELYLPAIEKFIAEQAEIYWKK